jgi:hypothetical protein
MAALIAGLFSLLNLIIPKEQKVSEFRQQWIDSLRQELSDHIAALDSLSSIFENSHTLDQDGSKTESELRQRITSTFTSIKLRVNPEDSHIKIRGINQEVLRLLEEGKSLLDESRWKEARIKCNEITNASIPMLKEESQCKCRSGSGVRPYISRSGSGVRGQTLHFTPQLICL